VKNEAVASTIATLLSSALRSGNGALQLSPSAPTRLVVLVVDVVPPVLECGALPDASSPFLSAPPAGALGAKYLRRIEAQPQITDPDLVLDSHAESVGRRTSPCDQRNKLLGSQRAAGRTGGNRSRPRCASTSWRRIEARRKCRASSPSGTRNGPVAPRAHEKHRWQGSAQRGAHRRELLAIDEIDPVRLSLIREVLAAHGYQLRADL
jgi:hypothetical protein